MNVTEFETMFGHRLVVRHWLLRAGMADNRHADVDDAIQEVYRRLWSGRERYVPQGEASYFPILKRISASVAVDFFRRAQARHDSPMHPDFHPPAADETARVEVRMRLLQILTRLQPDHRAMLWMRYVWGCTYEQIATSLGISPSQVPPRLKNAMQAAKREAARTQQETVPCPETPRTRYIRWTPKTAA